MLTVGFKSDLKKLDDNDIFDAVVVFANTKGGKLYLGVEDSGEITGVHSSHKIHLMPTYFSLFVMKNKRRC